MILVNLFKVKGITAMFCSLAHGQPESAATDIDVSCLAGIWKVKAQSNSRGRAGRAQDEPAAPRFAPVANGEHDGPSYFLKPCRMPGPNPVRKFVLSSAPFLRECPIESEGIRPVRYALPGKPLGAGREAGHGRKQSSVRTPFNLESKRHEQKSRGFAGL
jgi:hypothetical protein